MNQDDIEKYMKEFKDDEGQWKDPCHIAVEEGLVNLEAKAFNESLPFMGVDDDYFPATDIALVEVWFINPPPFPVNGIIDMNNQGLWVYDGDGCPIEPLYRLDLIPWHRIAGIRFHRST